MDGNNKCIECEGRLERDLMTDELVCSVCGLVVDELNISIDIDNKLNDNFDEWMNSVHRNIRDNSNSTYISYENGQSKEVKRLQWTDRNMTESSVRIMSKFYRLAKPASDSLFISDLTFEKACLIHKEFYERECTGGISYEVIVPAVLYTACRMDDVGVAISELSNIYRVRDKQIASLYKRIKKELNIVVGIQLPSHFIERHCSKYGVSRRIMLYAKKLIKSVEKHPKFYSKTPVGVSAGCILYSLANKGYKDSVVINRMSRITGVSFLTVNKHFKNIKKLFEGGELQ